MEKTFQESKVEIEDFAEVWDNRKFGASNFDKNNPTHQKIVQWALENFEENFEKF